MARQRKSLSLLVAILLFLFSAFAGAAQVRAIKGNKLLIQLDGSMFNVGDILKVRDASGHVRALAKVTKVAGRFAEAVYKGRPMQGYTVVLFPHDQFERWRMAMKRRRMMNRHRPYQAESATMGPKTTSYGVMLGYTSSSASVTLNNSSKVSLSGTGFRLMGYMDHPLLSWFSFRGEAGFDQFNTSGATNSACNNAACTAKITYLSADLLGRFTLNNLWGGLGVDLMFPLSKTSTALSSSSISTITAYALAAGYDFHYRGVGDPYIPVEVQYLMYPSSSTVTASELSLNVGWGKSF